MYPRKSELGFGNDDEVGDAIRVASLVSDRCCDRSESWLEVEEVVEGDRGVLYRRGAFECIEDSGFGLKETLLTYEQWQAVDCLGLRRQASDCGKERGEADVPGCSGRDAWVAFQKRQNRTN
jgi:hypothetical protein